MLGNTMPAHEARSTGVERVWTRLVWVAFGIILYLPAIGVAHAVFGTRLAIAYEAGSFIVFVAVAPRLWDWLVVQSERRRRVAAAILILISIGAFCALTPKEVGIVGFGSDRNEAVSFGTEALLRGRNPYREHTSRGMPLSQLPGELILAGPVVAVSSNGAWQTLIIWLAWLGIGCWLSPPEGRGLTCLGLLTLSTSLRTPYEVTLGEDLLSTGLQASIALALFVRAVPDRNAVTWQKAVAAAFLGLSLASRLSWVYGLLAIVRLPSPRRWWFVATATWLALVVPFWLASPEFGPLANPGQSFSTLGKSLLIAGTGGLAFALAPRQPSLWGVLANAALVQSVMAVVLMLGVLALTGRFLVGTLGYCALAQGCGVLSIVTYLVSRAVGPGSVGSH